VFFSVLLAGVVRADVLISAGHEGRPASCSRFAHRRCLLGAPGERAWTPIVADEATRMLRAHGVTVLREPADFDGRYGVDAAIFIHFDGASPPCSSAASVGYHVAAFASAAQLWRTMYGRYWPYGFRPDDFTANLRDYYGFRQVTAKNAALVLELGEITCPAQRNWLSSRLHFDGDLVAAYVSWLIGKGMVPLPAMGYDRARDGYRRPVDARF
jgi:hypothetical protein